MAHPLRTIAVAASIVALATACSDDTTDDGAVPAAPAADAPADETDAPSAPSAPSTSTSSGAAPTSEPAAEPDPTSTSAAPDLPAAPAEAVAGVTLGFDLRATLEQPVDVAWTPEGDALAVERTGTAVRLADDGSSEPILDLRDRVSTESERGLLGVAFSPDGTWLYASWSDLDGTSRLTAWAWSGSTLVADDGIDIASVEQPAANHNGGDVAVDPDGHLYWSLGDGGGANDQFGNGQDPSTLLGTIVRILPTPESGGYTIPEDNPFVGRAGRAEEIWLWGLRNPWRMTFDEATGDLWIGDVGQGAWEEIDRVTAADAGANLGWSCFEGVAVFEGCEVEGHLEPVVVYSHDLGNSVTGGAVYRGSTIPDLAGAYVFGDYGSGTVWALPAGASSSVDTGLGLPGLTSITPAPDGELWATTIGGEVGVLTPG